jgi:deoxyinosine 3'endonuclease (endonuclease V)
VVAADARFCEVVAERTEDVAEVLPYRPGEFYLRELPPIRMVLSGLSGLSGLGLLVADGYADLDPGGRPGLGAYAHAEFGIPVIGVAKTAFRTASHARARAPWNFGAPVVRHRGRDAPQRSSGASAAHGRTAPAARRGTPRRHTRTHEPARRRRTHSQAARLTKRGSCRCGRIGRHLNGSDECGRLAEFAL